MRLKFSRIDHVDKSFMEDLGFKPGLYEGGLPYFIKWLGERRQGEPVVSLSTNKTDLILVRRGNIGVMDKVKRAGRYDNNSPVLGYQLHETKSTTR